jgi:hypothetical protein
MAVDSQQLGDVPACLGLTAGQQIEHLEAWFLAAITFALQALLQGLYILRNNRKGVAHRVLS